ncbi:MAG: lipid-A-disaccharide synthase [Ignavibacteria bacterium GWA2_35_9]|nr:MAG: lipid-A-disaccharide synthase [Ignavibacteria bacterium GWA2_35_9]OGU46048.1 MAG: lipid-A-disaccharide synthase [Ignavibacteria bacterium GWB2_36_8]OGU48363.1 MAG: lipid-A-disaccharide synthase [Ignavibacteria bacterium GWC2_36_12]
MKGNKRNIMIIAGEVSGDILGGELSEELKRIDSEIKLCGIGGDKMKQAGVEIVCHINRLAFLGFAEVIRHIPFVKKVQNDLVEVIKEKNIKHIIMIDYPGFNLNFAKKIKPLGVKILYYVSPQVWAWGKGRIKKIKRLVRKMFVVFSFEEKIYSDEGIDVEFVGHPLLDRINKYDYLTKEKFIESYNLDPAKDILLVLPGSRKFEIEKIFPACVKAALRLKKEFNLQIVVAGASNIEEKLFAGISPLSEYKIIKNRNYELMKYSKVGIIKSGTSTLESGLFGLPMVIVYKTSRLTYFISKSLVNLKNIGMANIISGENVVPELIQHDVNPESIYREVKKILSDGDLFDSIKRKLLTIKSKLGSEGAAKRTARSIYSLLNEV